MSRFMFLKVSAVLLASLAYFGIPQQAHALFVVPPGGGFNNIGGGFNNLGGGGGNQQQQTPTIQRATNTLSNPVNYWQYSSITGVKPTIGTVRIYNQFGTLAGQNGQANQQQGGFGGGFGGFGGGLGGFGGGGMGNQLPGVGTSSGGDDPPQGVLLHVNYANLFFPNQAQLNQPNTGGGGGFGGIGGFGLGGFNGGFGKYQFGNGGSGL